MERLIAFGGEIKALGDGKISGCLVRFTNSDSPDMEQDFFNAGTDYDAVTGDGVTVYYAHGQDPVLKARKLGKGTIEINKVGVWIEAQLKMRDEYERAIYEMVEAKKLGWSSGSLSHLVERETVGQASWIKSWPLGEASITPTPAAGPELTQVVTFKAWQDANPNLKALLPKAAQDTATDDATVEGEPKPIEDRQETKDMDEKEVAAAIEKALTAEREAVKEAADAATKQQEAIDAAIKAGVEKALKAQKPDNEPGPAKKSVSINSKTKLGDTETKAYAYWLRTGDESAVKASNATDMNITTDADGGYAVPTGHYGEIIAKRDEMLIASRLGLRQIPGKGTTVNVPIDNEADGEFIVTGEASTFDLDAPALTTKAFTLAKYTKEIRLSLELLRDEDSKLMAFLADFVARGMAKTHNSLLLTEVASNGTALKTFASATVIAVDELEPVVYNEALSNYLDDSNSVGWVMQAAVHGEIVLIDDASVRRYAQNAQPDTTGRSLLGYPIVYSAKSGATAASAKSLYFGNWNYVGIREGDGFTVLRDPYSLASAGQVSLWYYFDVIYGVLQAEAIGYGVHPSA